MVRLDRRRDNDRGQLLVIGALVVALALFGSVVLLNSVHSSPDVAAQTDADSLSETDRLSGEFRQELRQLFLRTNASGLPATHTSYVDATYFNASVVAEFGAEYDRLLGTDRPPVVTVDYLASQRVSGALVYGNGSTLNGTVTLLNHTTTGGDVPSVSLTANVSSGGEIAFEFNDTSGTTASTFLNVTDSDVTKNEMGAGETTVCTFSGGNDTEITLQYGTGETAADTAFCRNVDVDIGTFDEVVLHGDSSDVESLDFQLSATGANCQVSTCVDRSTLPNIDLDPTFVTTIETPSSSYNSTIDLYRGG